MLLVLAAVVAGCGDSGKSAGRTRTQKPVVPGTIGGELRGAAYFDADGLMCLPYQRNLAPNPSLKQPEAFRNGQKPKGWQDPVDKNAAVTYINNGSGQTITATATADGATATIGITVPVAPDKINSTWEDSLALGDYADAIAAAIDVDITSSSEGAGATLALSGQDGSVLGRAIKTNAGPGRIKILDAARLSSESSVSLVFGVELPRKGSQITAVFKDAQFNRTYWHTGRPYEQGPKPYLHLPVLEGGPGAQLLTEAGEKIPAGIWERMDGRFVVPVSSSRIDASQAWWQAVEFVPNFNESDQDTFDRDLIDWNLDPVGDLMNGVWTLMTLFKKPAHPEQDAFGPHLGGDHKTHAYIYQYFPDEDGGGNENEAVTSTEFTFSAGDTIRVVSAFLPEGGEGLAPGRYVWTTVNGVAYNGPESFRDLPAYTGNDEDVDRLHDISVCYDRYDNSGLDQAEYDAGRPLEFSANGKFRYFYVQQGAISQSLVDAFLKDPARVGVRYEGIFFPFDSANKLQGYGDVGE